MKRNLENIILHQMDFKKLMYLKLQDIDKIIDAFESINK